MKIVLDFRKYDGVIGGVEQGVIQLTKHVTELDHYLVLLCKKNRHQETLELFRDIKNLKILPLDVTTHVISRENTLLDSIVIQEIALKEKADVIHFPYNWSFPLNKQVPSVLTIHDVIPFTFREAQSFYMHFFKYRPNMRKAASLNNMVATVSHFSKQDIARKLGVPLEKIRVIYNGLREPNPADASLEEDLKEKFGLTHGFILNVGGIHERKNVVRLIQAYSTYVQKSGYGGKLVITGSASGKPYQEKMRSQCEKTIDGLGIRERITFTDFISENELDSLFRMADLMVYPSLYEGFGIPVLEAMKMGVPVITSNTTALPEVAGDAALLINPESVEEMVSAIARVLEDEKLRQELKEKGQLRAREFTWEKNAKSYLELYRELSGK